MKTNVIAAVLFALASLPSFSQSKLPEGVWVKTKVETASGKVTPRTKKRDEGYLKYTFDDGKLYISTNSTGIGAPQDYELLGNVILLPYFNFKIDKIDENNLVLIELDDNKVLSTSTKLFFASEQSLIDGMAFGPADYYVRQNDTIFCQSEYVCARFKSPQNFYGYISNDAKGLKPKEPAFTYATFLVDEKGGVSDVTIYHYTNETYDNDVRRKLSKTKGMWTPFKYKGQKRKTLMFYKIGINTIKTIDFKSANDFKPGGYTRYGMGYEDAFIAGVILMRYAKFEDAIAHFKDAASLTADPANAYHQLSKCYAALGDGENRDFYLEKVKWSGLKYVLESEAKD
jgi:hypothetical protein